MYVASLVGGGTFIRRRLLGMNIFPHGMVDPLAEPKFTGEHKSTAAPKSTAEPKSTA